MTELLKLPKMPKLPGVFKLPTVGAMAGRQRKDVTSEDMYNIAQQFGFKEQADQILAEKGEDADRIFGGGFISDVFDGLNLIQYGVVGMLQGEGFAQGVKTRRSFSDKDLMGKYGIAGTIGGIGADILADPLTYITPWALAKHIPGISKGLKATRTAIAATKPAKWFTRKLIGAVAADPIFASVDWHRITGIVRGQEKIMKLAGDLQTIDPAIRKVVGRMGRGTIRPEKLTRVAREAIERMKPAFDKLDEMSQAFVDLGVLSPKLQETYLGNIGTYMHRAYAKWDFPETAKGFKEISKFWETGKGKGIPALLKKARKDIPEEIRRAMGEIFDVGYLTPKAMLRLNLGIENAKFFNRVGRWWGSDVAKEGFSQVGKSWSFGKLKNKWVPDIIHDHITEVMRIPSKAEKAMKAGMKGFKLFHTVFNPATVARNVPSNMILNWFHAGLNPLDPRAIDAYTIGAKEMFRKGGKYMKEIYKKGYGLNTYAAAELGSMIVNPNARPLLGKAGAFGKKAFQKVADLYQGSENFAKISAYVFNRKHKGMGIGKAWRIAEEATFNYSQVPKFVRYMREKIWGYPFITFPAKATPIVLKTAMKYPRRISAFGKVRKAIEQMSDLKETAAERKAEPQWIKDGFYIKLPMKDKQGRSAYFDLTYIIPFGDLVSGQLFERQIDRETGLKESHAEAVLKKAPLLNLITEIGKNQDFYGNKIWRDADNSERQLGDLFRHITKMYIPPVLADQLPGGYVTKGRRAGQRRPQAIRRAMEADSESQYRNVTQEILRNVGIKIQPVNLDIQQLYHEWEKRNALRTLLQEAGVLREYTRPYVAQ